MVAPLTPTICNISANPCGTPGSVPVCPQAGAAVSTDAPFAPVIGVETLIDFEVDVYEFGGTNADSVNERIVIGENAVYTVVYTATYGPGPVGGTITARLKVNGITQVTFVHSPSTSVSEVSNISLNDGDFLTVTVEPSFEGASVTFASLAANKICGPATDVIIPQG